MWWYLMLCLLGNERDCQLEPLTIRTPSPLEVESVVKGCNQFSFDVHHQLQSSGDNVFFSPYSICAAFSMVLLGSNGNTAKQLRNTFHYDENLDVHTVFRKLISDFEQQNSKKYTLKTASRLFISRSFEVSFAYQKIMQHFYAVTMKRLEFGTGEAEGIINQWVADQTNNLIPELFSPNSLCGDTELVLANAIYFKDAWEQAFDEGLTEKKKFRLLNGNEVEVDMMKQVGEFTYSEDTELNAKVLMLPYSGQRLSMLIILPNDVFGLPTLIKKLTAEKVIKLMEAWEIEVVVKIPKFKLETELDLKDILIELSITDLFNGRANLSGISEKHLEVSKVKHKAFVKVDEEGTEAAAATGIVFVGRSLTYPQEFFCDHPFYFAIFDNASKFILFSGVIMEPKIA